MGWKAARFAQRGYRFVLQVHDELVFCIPDDPLEEANKSFSRK